VPECAIDDSTGRTPGPDVRKASTKPAYYPLAMDEPVTCNDLHTPRRQHSRLRLGLRAALETLEGRQSVRLLDLSRSGAKLALDGPEMFRQGILAWLGFEAFGEVVWREGRLAGLQFDETLPLELVIETRHRAPDVVREESLEAYNAARDWVAGTLNIGLDR